MEKIVLEIFGNLENFAAWLKEMHKTWQAGILENDIHLLKTERDYGMTEKEIALQAKRQELITLLAPKEEEPIAEEPIREEPIDPIVKR